MSTKNRKQSEDRNVALCYVRLSKGYSASDDKLDSPERQCANIELACTLRQWKMEWYEDTDGHRSGTKEVNRPGWMALKARLHDPDVVAIVANDLSRLHRKSWRIGDLLDFVDEHDIALVLAAPGRDLDTSSPMGRVFAQIAAIFDEYYAHDISVRQRDTIAHRRKQGKAINLLFGTQRSKDGYLDPSVKGAWLLPNGHHIAGIKGEEPPCEGAVWRGYFECVERIFEIYTQGKAGYSRVAEELNAEGWAFKNRYTEPRPFDQEDVRRIVHSWPEYGGAVLGNHARNRSIIEFNSSTVQLVPERALFPIETLCRVADVIRLRSHAPINRGVKQTDNTYPMHGLLYCAHCEQIADEQADPTKRSKLWGHNSRYRHRDGRHSCGCTNRSVPCAELDADLGRLLDSMTIRDDLLPRMLDYIAQLNQSQNQISTLESQRQSAIARANRRIQAAKRLFKDGEMDEAEYDARLQEAEQEIETWQRMDSETEQVEYEVRKSVQALAELAGMWHSGTPDQRQSIMKSMFSYVVYDLDTRRITGFRLKSWVEQVLELRVDTEFDRLNRMYVTWSRRASRLYLVLRHKWQRSAFCNYSILLRFLKNRKRKMKLIAMREMKKFVAAIMLGKESLIWLKNTA